MFCKNRQTGQNKKKFCCENLPENEIFMLFRGVREYPDKNSGEDMLSLQSHSDGMSRLWGKCGCGVNDVVPLKIKRAIMQNKVLRMSTGNF